MGYWLSEGKLSGQHSLGYGFHHSRKGTNSKTAVFLTQKFLIAAICQQAAFDTINVFMASHS